MIHISFSQGCHDGLGCGDEEDDDDALRCKREESALLAALISCRAAMHPYDPGSSSQDTHGCVVTGLAGAPAQTPPKVINPTAKMTVTVRIRRQAPASYA